MTKKVIVKFTQDELNKLVEDKSSCVTVHKSVYNIALFPYHLGDISSSIKELLNSKIAKYDKRLDGILLGYKHLKLLTHIGSIVADSCYIHVDIEGDFYIFKPAINSALIGVVNKISENHIGCLVHRLFNISVPNDDRDNWPGFNVNIGDEVSFIVTRIELDARLPYIRASFVSSKTKKKQKFKKEIDESDKVIKELKLNKQNELLNSETNNDENDNIYVETPTKEKKKKKRTSYNISEEEHDLNNFKKEINESIDDKNNVSLLKKKKKHSKKEKELEELLSKSENSFIKNNKINNKVEATKIKKKKHSDKNVDSKNSYVEQNNEMNISLTKTSKKRKHSECSEYIESTAIDKSLNTNIEHTSVKKKKRKSNDKDDLNDFKTPTKKDNKHVSFDENNGMDAIRELALAEQLAKFNTSSKKAKRHSRIDEGSKQNKKSTKQAIIESAPTATKEGKDRKIKKNKSTSDQSKIWENRDLNLYDSDLEKTLGTPSKNQDSLEKSLHFNLVKISALNDKNPKSKNGTRNSLSDFEEPNSKKRKRKKRESELSDDILEVKPKKQKLHHSEQSKPVTMEKKSKKSKK